MGNKRAKVTKQKWIEEKEKKSRGGKAARVPVAFLPLHYRMRWFQPKQGITFERKTLGTIGILAISTG